MFLNFEKSFVFKNKIKRYFYDNQILVLKEIIYTYIIIYVSYMFRMLLDIL